MVLVLNSKMNFDVLKTGFVALKRIYGIHNWVTASHRETQLWVWLATQTIQLATLVPLCCAFLTLTYVFVLTLIFCIFLKWMRC